MNGFMSPKEVAESVAESGKKKAELGMMQMMVLGILAGVYIGFGAQLSTLVTHDLSKYLGIGFARFMGGSVFTVGLMLVVIAGAELFTGNCLMMTGLLKGSCSVKGMLRNWFFVYLANFAGSLLLVCIMFYSGLWKMNNAGVGGAALKVAIDKVNLPFMEAFSRGIGCNWLVCLAVWLAVAGRDSVSKIFGIYFPIMAFVASGFEHSIANMFFIPAGIFATNAVSWGAFFINNLLPVTLGNIVGGGLFVATIYWWVYLRGQK